MAKAKKLASGSWRCLVYDYTDANKKRIYKSFTADTKKEAEYLASEFLAHKDKVKESQKKMTVAVGLDYYIKSKEQSLSPTTLTAYKSMQNNLFGPINDMFIPDLDSAQVQIWIGYLNEERSPKTIRNVYGLFSSMVDTFYPDKHFKVKLPQKEKKTVYVPTDADVKTLINYYQEHDRDLYIACLLAAFGTLRRSEACALTADDVKGNTISVNKALVQNGETGEWVIKTTKTTSSTRLVELPEFVVKEFPKSGRLIKITPTLVSNRFLKTFKKLKMPSFRYHDLRHYSASIMHAIGVPDVYIMERGGWSSDSTLKQIYRGSMDDYSKKFTDMTNKHFETMQHEMQHKKQKPQ